MILGWKISIEYKSSIMLDNLRNVYYKFILEKEDPLAVLMVDDGIENKGHVCTAIENQEIKLNKLIAQKDITLFKPQLEQAKLLRKAENKALSCDSCAFSTEN